ncbi:MAG TPA: hypothetical protein VIX59_21585 [Candidatus Binataceae bacterium]
MKTCYDAARFVAKGYRRREFIPHRVVALRKAYPDAYLLLERRGVPPERLRTGECWQLNLYSPQIDGFPSELFTDPIVNWHSQQFGEPGLIAAAGLFIDGASAFVTTLQSDLCQQIAKHPGLKKQCASHLDKRFRYWYEILFNAVLDFAIDYGLEVVYSPTGALIAGKTRKRIDPALFLQIYDSVENRYEATRERVGDAEYWRVGIAENLDRIARLEQGTSRTRHSPARVICLYHDIEESVDTDVAREECESALVRMLEVERTVGVRATYNVLGELFARKVPAIVASDSHAIAFHTYNHRLDDVNQLAQVRRVNLQVKGYRPARSIVTPELSDYALRFHNFEWLMSSASSLKRDRPEVENGIVKIPVHLDDYSLSTGAESYEQWENHLFALVNERSFVAVGLHDCYSKFWIDNYLELLSRLQTAGELWTCDQVLDHVILSDAREEIVPRRKRVDSQVLERAGDAEN